MVGNTSHSSSATLDWNSLVFRQSSPAFFATRNRFPSLVKCSPHWIFRCQRPVLQLWRCNNDFRRCSSQIPLRRPMSASWMFKLKRRVRLQHQYRTIYSSCWMLWVFSLLRRLLRQYSNHQHHHRLLIKPTMPNRSVLVIEPVAMASIETERTVRSSTSARAMNLLRYVIISFSVRLDWNSPWMPVPVTGQAVDHVNRPLKPSVSHILRQRPLRFQRRLLRQPIFLNQRWLPWMGSVNCWAFQAVRRRSSIVLADDRVSIEICTIVRSSTSVQRTVNHRTGHFFAMISFVQPTMPLVWPPVDVNSDKVIPVIRWRKPIAFFCKCKAKDAHWSMYSNQAVWVPVSVSFALLYPRMSSMLCLNNKEIESQ